MREREKKMKRVIGRQTMRRAFNLIKFLRVHKSNMPVAITNTTKVEWDCPQISIRIRGIYTDINAKYDGQCALNEIQISLFPSLPSSVSLSRLHSFYQFVKNCVICHFEKERDFNAVEQVREQTRRCPVKVEAVEQNLCEVII